MNTTANTFLENEHRPLLSICIPTYNRANCLRQTILSITNQSIFQQTRSVEIIISDNCSDDDTESISKSFVEKFPGKVFYNKNETNIFDGNFEKALSLGHGYFLKLHNDNLIFNDNTLDNMLQIIKDNITNRPIIFFANGNATKKRKIIYCKNMNEFVAAVSFFSTWIGAFGIWKEQLAIIHMLSEYKKTRLIQTKILLHLLDLNNAAVVYNKILFSGINTPNTNNRGHFNYIETFGKNYLSMYQEYLVSKKMDVRIYSKEKRRLLYNHIVPYYFFKNNDYNFIKTGFISTLWPFYKYDYCFYMIPFCCIWVFFRRQLKKIKILRDIKHKYLENCLH